MYAITGWKLRQQQGRELLDSVGPENLQRQILGDSYAAVTVALGPSKATTAPSIAQARTAVALTAASAVAGPSRTTGSMVAARAAHKAPSGSSGTAPLPAPPASVSSAVVAPKRKTTDTIDLTTPSPEPKRAR
jgi:hypothetical protein